MAELDLKWCFYNPVEKTKTSVISTHEAQLAILNMRTSEIRDYYIWRSDWSEWKPLQDYISAQKSPLHGFTALTRSDGNTNFASNKSAHLHFSNVDAETQHDIEKTFSGAKNDVQILLLGTDGKMHKMSANKITVYSAHINNSVSKVLDNKIVEVVLLKNFGQEKLNTKCKVKFINDKITLEFQYSDDNCKLQMIKYLKDVS